MADTQRPAIETPLCEAHIAKGDWNPLWDQLRELDPEFMEAYLAFRSVPQRNGPLPQKYKELILVAINAATTHLYGPGVRRHMRNAIKAGATREELLEAIQLTTVMGIHSCNLAVPILMEETDEQRTA
ncbi:carboxymuconolactone decarboxylase family protein [Bordetella genomosp. 13]|uniref:carboxymuconolactone decarboxylase family protein n=1 Tax=Bordetella genomosp. 13 TaxID=463040 RepID=UPI0011A2E266|nr:carboxymuconolactone decarboxylase family protein [Bordetella genomosp. 13]